ncbi:endonuclease domain-containing protein [Micromonospora craterilacus]|nr:endonuclease domain-containing protein [Micromonospora craterilacus]
MLTRPEGLRVGPTVTAGPAPVSDTTGTPPATAQRSLDLPVVGTLADLPEHRREAALWHFAYDWTYGGLDYDGVDDLVRDQSPLPCLRRPHPGSAQDLTAVLGSDGRYHLCRDNGPVCASKRRRSDGASGYRHEQTVRWWVSSIGYHTRLRLGTTAVRHERIVQWQVELTQASIDPALVRGRQRCAARAEWPGYQGTDTALGRMRAALVAAAGARCHACGGQAGTSVDHDHLTNQVRGLLCLPCNNQIEHCLHVANCPFADYLNSPPAAHLNFAYPRPYNVRHTSVDDLRVEHLGFDPRYGRGSKRR